MVGRLPSFGEGLFSSAMLVWGRRVSFLPSWKWKMGVPPMSFLSFRVIFPFHERVATKKSDKHPTTDGWWVLLVDFWVVIPNMCFNVHPENCGRWTHFDDHIFSMGLKPPTRSSLVCDECPLWCFLFLLTLPWKHVWSVIFFWDFKILGELAVSDIGCNLIQLMNELYVDVIFCKAWNDYWVYLHTRI